MAGTQNGKQEEVNDKEMNQEVNDQEVTKEVDATKGATGVVRPNSLNCTVEFIGACQGIPGQAGAGAVVREEKGRKVYCVREGLSNTAIEVAEYKALILGLNLAVRKGYKHIRAIGDSRLVINQVQRIWNVSSENLVSLHNEAMQLRKMFQSFSMIYKPREQIVEALRQANLALNLEEGVVEEEEQ